MLLILFQSYQYIIVKLCKKKNPKRDTFFDFWWQIYSIFAIKNQRKYYTLLPYREKTYIEVIIVSHEIKFSK